MFGGALPQPISNCVPAVAPPPLPIITDIPDELRANSITPWPAAPAPAMHLGFGLAEKHLNHIATGAYNSGLFCIGISSEQVPQLDAGLFGLLLPSLNQLSDQFKAGDSHPAMGLSIRPQKPPVITLGDNKDFKSPLLDIQLKDTDLDFYSWSEDRFVRLFTGRIDIRVPMNMEAGKDGIALKFADKTKDGQPPIQFTNPRVSNNTILLEKDAAVGKLVESIGGLIPASALGNIKPFKLDSALASFGVKLTIPPEGIRKVVNKDGDPFLGIFASLELSGAAMPTSKTSAAVRSVKVDAKNFALGTTGEAPPEVVVHADSNLDDGSHKVQYAYRVDRGPQSMFAEGRDFTVRSPFFILQGKHTVFVSSRLSGVADSEGEAVALPVVIDTLAPFVAVQNVVPGLVKIQASDLVTDAQDLKVEARIDGGPWFTVNIGEIKDPKNGLHTRLDRVVAVPLEATSIEVRAGDSSGNTASISSALIRGRSDGSLPPKSGCGCSVPGGSGDSGATGAGLLGGLALLGAVLERRRRTSQRVRSLACASAVLASAGAAGCNCSKGDDQPVEPPDNRAALVSYVLGSYTSAATATDGKIWVAGYNEGDPSGGTSDDFHGDLVVGLLDPTTNVIQWNAVDGVPNVPPTKNHKGFRGGVTDPGDDVGLYTSMALDGKGNPVVGYFDRTNGSLRISRYDGKAWSSYELDHIDKGWAGKFTSLVNASGKLAIAYQTMEAGASGWAKAKVKVAMATGDSPATQGDWTLQDVTVDDKTPCIQAVCSTGQKCLAGDKTNGIDPICTATTVGCDATCADVCIKNPVGGAPTCVKGKTELGLYVNALGLFNSLAATPTGTLGLVFYDRFHGNLRAASNAGGKWTVTPTTAPLDGWVGDAAKDKGNGDRGIGATLAIDSSGNWHVAYVDGIKEMLLYKFIAGGDLSKPIAPVTVDDGNSPDGAPANAFKDGNHLIGENAHLVVDGATIRIVYQDSTAGTLRWAKGTAGPAPKFSHGVIKQDGLAGFWPRIVGDQVVNFFRMKGTTVVAGDETGTAEGDPLIIGNVRATTIP
jgi:MYXO-CTERM domain-containing protein